MADNKIPVVKPPVVAAPAAPPKSGLPPKPGLLVTCLKCSNSPAPAKVDGHDCMREEYWATFQTILKPGNSHPTSHLTVKSLEQLPYRAGDDYELIVSPRKK